MVMAFKFGPMAQGMKDIGKMTKQMELGNWSTQMGTNMKATGLMIRPKDRELILTQTVPIIGETGLMTSSTDSALKVGLMAPITKVTIATGRKKAMEN